MTDPAFLLPAWATRRVAVESEADAVFLCGAALLALDRIVRAEPIWAGAWRQRLALKSALIAVRLVGRREAETELRDAWVLRKPGDDAGPAGDIYGVWKKSAARPMFLETETLKNVALLLGLSWREELDELPLWCDAARRKGIAPSLALATILQRIITLGPQYELLAWWVADQLLRDMMQWPATVPLLMAERNAVYFRAEKSQKRLSPDADTFPRAVALALADAATGALRLAAEIDRRASDLSAVVPKLRAKGAGDVIDLLLSDDAVSGSLATSRLSRFASRRLFERLLSFGVIRELSGRPNFRIFGL
ncbi:DUF1403 family protein [Rhizobium sp. FY34]|uniref:DUF1403 family protein n=1 Tax=Rhizobium sp. FY34 TaxID=2562309 RepID=UPI001FEE7AC6|nr:DUF1403 family protein [Rhizobium sp. FY34]